MTTAQKNIEDMTMQEAYEAIIDWYSDPTHSRAVSRDGCEYRTINGQKCAVGCLLTDSQLDAIEEKNIQHHGVSSLINEEILSIESVEFSGFLTDMQDAHDWGGNRPHSMKIESVPKEESVAQMHKVAQKYGLNPYKVQ